VNAPTWAVPKGVAQVGGIVAKPPPYMLIDQAVAQDEKDHRAKPPGLGVSAYRIAPRRKKTVVGVFAADDIRQG